MFKIRQEARSVDLKECGALTQTREKRECPESATEQDALFFRSPHFPDSLLSASTSFPGDRQVTRQKTLDLEVHAPEGSTTVSEIRRHPPDTVKEQTRFGEKTRR